MLLSKAGLGAKGLRHKWLRLDSEGDTLVLTTGKSSLTARLGVQVQYLGLSQHSASQQDGPATF